MNHQNRQAIGYCPKCHKLLYPSRKAAKKIGHSHPGHKNAYRCPDNDNFWHIGALPVEIRHGHVTKSDFYEYQGRYAS